MNISDEQPEDIIRRIVKETVGGRVVLFGSRARKNHRPDSDYDLLVIVEREIPIKEKIRMTTIIGDLLLDNGIVADVIIKSEEQIMQLRDQIGSIVKYALQEGIVL